jgi:hypothetical protein
MMLSSLFSAHVSRPGEAEASPASEEAGYNTPPHARLL